MNNSLTLNRATTYLLPLVNIQLDKYNHRLISAFITDTSMNIDVENHIIIQLTAGVNDSLLVEDDVVTIYRKQIGSNLFDIVVVRIPDEFKSSADKILVGLYSEIQDKAKERIIKFPLNKTNPLLRAIFNKSQVLKDAWFDQLKSPVEDSRNIELRELLNSIDLDENINDEDYLKEVIEILN